MQVRAEKPSALSYRVHRVFERVRNLLDHAVGLGQQQAVGLGQQQAVGLVQQQAVGLGQQQAVGLGQPTGSGIGAANRQWD